MHWNKFDNEKYHISKYNIGIKFPTYEKIT